MSVYLEKLSTSGLDANDAKVLGFEFLKSEQTKELQPHFKEKDSIKIPYFKPSGEPLSDIDGAEQFYRVRYLDKKRTGFAALTKPKGAYDQPKGALPTAYWPLNNDWSKVVSKPLEPLLITEGELKAAKACKEGFSTVAVGGANNWHLKGRTKELISSLQFCTWVRRPVYLCFDADYLHKKGVVLGLKRLSDTLTMHGAYVHILTLPEVYSNGDKTGLDDFLVVGGSGAVNHLREMIEQAMPYCDAAKLFKLNDRYTIIASLSCVYDKVLDEKRPLDKFKTAIQRTNMLRIQKLPPAVSDTGEPVFSYTYKRAVDVWLDWPLQNCVDSLVYEPGNPRNITTSVKGTEIKKLNLWDGWGIEPKKGDVSLYIQLVDYFFSENPLHKSWFLQWMAYPIQNPGAKLYTACVFHGITHGTGKSLLAYTVRGVYGANWVELKQDDVQRDWNAILITKQFAMADEMTGSKQRKFSDLIKSMITSSSNIVNEKWVPLYAMRNCVNYIFTSNHPDSFYLEDSDRRLFIMKAPLKPLDESFFKAYDKWYLTPPHDTPREEASSALLYYFLNEVDTTGFNPKGRAPNTDSKQEMLELTRSDLGEFVRQLRDYTDVVLDGVKRDLLNSKEILNLYDPFGKGKVTSNGVSREMARAGALAYDGGKKLRVNGTVTRYYILRNNDKWERALLQDVVDHVRDNNAYTTETSKF